METETETGTGAGPTETALDVGPRRSDRWSSEPPGRDSNWWVGVAAVFVLAGYALAALVVAAARGSLALSDETEKALVAATPSCAALGSALAVVGTRRASLRGLSWVVFVVGVLLVAATIAATAWLLLTLRTFS